MRTILITFFICGSCFAGYPEKILYWYNQNVSTNHVDILDVCEISLANGTYSFKWLIQNPPSKATIDAIDNATATAWFNGAELDESVDYDKWTERERRMFKLLVKEINKLRVKNGDSAYTKAQVMEALKQE